MLSGKYAAMGDDIAGYNKQYLYWTNLLFLLLAWATSSKFLYSFNFLHSLITLNDMTKQNKYYVSRPRSHRFCDIFRQLREFPYLLYIFQRR